MSHCIYSHVAVNMTDVLSGFSFYLFYSVLQWRKTSLRNNSVDQRCLPRCHPDKIHTLIYHLGLPLKFHFNTSDKNPNCSLVEWHINIFLQIECLLYWKWVSYRLLNTKLIDILDFHCFVLGERKQWKDFQVVPQSNKSWNMYRNYNINYLRTEVKRLEMKWNDYEMKFTVIYIIGGNYLHNANYNYNELNCHY